MKYSSLAFAQFRNELYQLSNQNIGVSLNARHRTREVIEASMRMLNKTLGVKKIAIATVRERSGFRGNRLRHVYAYPDTVREYFDKESDGEDSIYMEAFTDPRVRDFSISLNVMDQSVARIGVLDIKSARVEGVCSSQHEAWTFPERIEQFLSDMKKQKKVGAVGRLPRICNCIVFGLGKDDLIDQMVAIYVGKCSPVDKEIATQCSHVLLEMFRVISEIRVNESMTFEHEAMAKIVELLPKYASQEVSPSDAVAMLLDKFNEIFREHEYFGPGRFAAYRDKNSQKNQHQWATFMSVTYRQPQEEGQPPTPILSVHPKSAASCDYRQSYWLSRPETRSVSKCLLYQYLTAIGEPTPRDLREKLNCDEVSSAFLTSGEARLPMGLVMTSRDEALWDNFQFHFLSEDREIKTTAAFILARTGDSKQLPFAVLAFESDCPDAFSRTDIDLIARLVNASASLLCNVKFSKNAIDYSGKLKESFGGWVDHDINGVLYSNVAYELIRCDHNAALDILSPKDTEDRYWGDSALCEVDVRKKVSKIIRLARKIQTREGSSGLQNWLWNNDAFEQIDTEWSQYIDDIHEFLMAVPPNDVWYCYLGSIDHALDHRNFKSADEDGDSRSINLPTFTLYQPGYSALAMFIVDVEHQTRQIAKLTTYDKLTEERDKYNEHVRYKIPLAARIPVNGISFDTIGSAAHGGKRDGYGVIVSDLVAGNRHSPFTFLSSCALLARCLESKVDINSEDIESALKYHFETNLMVWQLEGEADWPGPYSVTPSSVSSFIEKVTRIQIPGSRFASYDDRMRHNTKEIESQKGLDGRVLDTLEACVRYFEITVGELHHEALVKESDKLAGYMNRILSLRKKRPADTPGFTNMGSHEFFSPAYIHGDLNGHNLAWATHYRRFVMIDFEHIKLGFVGVDQLKLLASLICEMSSAAKAHARLEGVPYTGCCKQHYTTMSLIRLIRWFSYDLLRSGDYIEELNKKKNSKGDVGELDAIALSIIETIGLEKLDLGASERKFFWQLLIRNIFYLQFEYAYRELAARHSDELDALNDAVRIANTNNRETFNGNVLSEVKGDTVIMLFYSFMGLLATLWE